jgi:hypothetical protein
VSEKHWIMKWGQLLVLYLNAFIGIEIFSDENFKFFVDLQTKRQIFLLIIHYYQLNLHQIGFLFDISPKKNHILRNFRTFSELAKTTMAKINKK